MKKDLFKKFDAKLRKVSNSVTSKKPEKVANYEIKLDEHLSSYMKLLNDLLPKFLCNNTHVLVLALVFSSLFTILFTIKIWN